MIITYCYVSRHNQ